MLLPEETQKSDVTNSDDQDTMYVFTGGKIDDSIECNTWNTSKIS